MDYLIFFAGLVLLMSYLKHEEEEPESDEVHLYYYRSDANFENWKIWVWNFENPSTGQSIDAELIEIEKSRARYRIPLFDQTQIGILPYFEGWKDKDGPDRILDNRCQLAQGQKLHLVEGEEQLRKSKPVLIPKITNAFLDTESTIQIQLPRALSTSENEQRIKNLKIQNPLGSKLPLSDVVVGEDGRELLATLEKPLKLSDKQLSQYEVHFRGFKKVLLQPRGILFDSTLNYDVPMGLIVDSELQFCCFAPTATQVSVLIFDQPGQINDGSKPLVCIPMQEIKCGLWQTTASKNDHLGHYYSYLVEGSDYKNNLQREAIDPYAKLLLGLRSRAKIFENHDSVADSPIFEKSESVIYELHLRDFSADPRGGVYPEGKFCSLGRVNCRHLDYPKLKTGLDHLKDLGVNTLQILPTHFFDVEPSINPYDWGYMPAHYFSLYPGYAENPQNAISEFKQLVSNLHSNGFKVVLDVVLNHTSENIENAYSFQALAPGYYYRRTHTGHYFNGSGCGNEFKSEAPMARKFILDYLKYWAQEFKIDGFRFDLMGLMDYETFRLINDELKRINPNILLYGEPWAADNAGVPILGKGCQRETNFSVFNDHYRDALRGDNSAHGRGFVQGEGKAEKIAHGFFGSIHDFCSSPTETINYVACHDNYTLRDKLELSGEHKDETALQKMERIIAVLLMTSQGLPLLHNGQEFGRSKQHNHNSYNAPLSVNQIIWEDRKTRQKLFEFHKKLIELRLQHKVFRMTDRSLIDRNLKWIREYSGQTVPDNMIIFGLRSEGILDSFKEVLIFVNCSANPYKADLPSGAWKQFIRNDKVWTKINSMPSLNQSNLVIPSGECLAIAQINH